MEGVVQEAPIITKDEASGDRVDDNIGKDVDTNPTPTSPATP